jgi:hypothetical protein
MSLESPVMRAAAVALLLAVALSRPARAFEEFQGTRALAMGGATRAWAVGDSAPLLNPSGMTLVKSYNVEASYLYASRLQGHFFHASVVDSTSSADVAGALYYTYHTDQRGGLAAGHGHEGGASLALPLGGFLSVGGTAKWFQLVGSDEGPALARGGLTFDAGVTVRPTAEVSLAVVGANLRDLHAGQAPLTLSYGAAYLPMPDLVLALDGLTSFTRDDVSGARGTGVQGGVEWSIAQRVGLRAGGGTDPFVGAGFLSAGVSALSEMGAVDVGVRGDLFPMRTGSTRNLFVGVSLRLFVLGAMVPASP